MGGEKIMKVINGGLQVMEYCLKPFCNDNGYDFRQVDSYTLDIENVVPDYNVVSYYYHYYDRYGISMIFCYEKGKTNPQNWRAKHGTAGLCQNLTILLSAFEDPCLSPFSKIPKERQADKNQIIQTIKDFIEAWEIEKVEIFIVDDMAVIRNMPCTIDMETFNTPPLGGSTPEPILAPLSLMYPPRQWK